MVRLLGMLLTMMVFLGGVTFQIGNLWAALTIAGLGAIGLGTLVAAVQSGATQPSFAFDTTEGLTLNQLWMFLTKDTTDLTADTTVYLGTEHGLHVATGLFTCVLDGRKALVIERETE